MAARRCEGGAGRPRCRRGRLRRCHALLWCLLLAPGGLARAAEPEDEREEIVVVATRSERSRTEVPASIDVVDRDSIRRARSALTLAEALEGVPGVFAQNRGNFAQDLRISMRGFGARANFGLRGIRLYVDGIPSTLPDGQGQVDSLQLASAARIEVLRGPSAALYGGAAGGVIAIESEAPPETPFLEARSAFGLYGFRSHDLAFGGRRDDFGYRFAVSRQDVDGYRDHSSLESTTVNGQLRWQIDESSDLIVNTTGAYVPRAEDPGGIDRAQRALDRRSARSANLDFDAGERLWQLAGGARYRNRLGEHLGLEVTGWSGFRRFENKLPITSGGIVSFDRVFAGGGLQVVEEHPLFGRSNRLTAGVSVEAQRDARQRADNDLGRVGATVLDQYEEVVSLRGYVQNEHKLVERVDLLLSLAVDGLRYGVEDRFPADSFDASGHRWLSEISPAAALLYHPTETLATFVRVATAFEPPTTTEFARPGSGGGFDPDLEPQHAIGVEAGARGRLPGRVRYEAAVFYTHLRDELVSYQLPPPDDGRDFFRNANRSHRLGVELALEWRPIPPLELRLAYTALEARFLDYTVAGGSYDGNAIPGEPEHRFDANLVYEHDSGLYGELSLRAVSERYTDDANTTTSSGYAVADLRLGWEGMLGPVRVSPYLALENLFDEAYDDNVRINAFGGRFFEPAPGFSVHGGIGVLYEFGGS